VVIELEAGMFVPAFAHKRNPKRIKMEGITHQLRTSAVMTRSQHPDTLLHKEI